jgi:cytochrome c-type biogenesis protein CcmH/NrfF
MKIARNMLHRWALGLLLASTLLLMGASGDRTGQRFDRLGHNLMCECGCNQVLLECNHVGCSTSEQMRQELKLSMARGDKDDVVLAGFVAKYGPPVLSAPTTTGFNRVAWIMPIVIFFASLTAVVLVVRAWKNRNPPDAPASSGGTGPGELDEFRRRAREETTL